MKAYVLKTNGEKQEASPRPKSGDLHPKTFELEQLQDIVGGWIGIIDLTDGVVMVINEEGKLDDLDLNRKATDIFNKVFPENPDYIVGDVLVCDSSMIK